MQQQLLCGGGQGAGGLWWLESRCIPTRGKRKPVAGHHAAAICYFSKSFYLAWMIIDISLKCPRTHMQFRMYISHRKLSSVPSRIFHTYVNRIALELQLFYLSHMIIFLPCELFSNDGGTGERQTYVLFTANSGGQWNSLFSRPFSRAFNRTRAGSEGFSRTELFEGTEKVEWYSNEWLCLSFSKIQDNCRNEKGLGTWRRKCNEKMQMEIESLKKWSVLPHAASEGFFHFSISATHT